MQEEKAPLPETLALINEFSHQPRSSHFPLTALPMWLSLPSPAVPRLRQKNLSVKVLMDLLLLFIYFIQFIQALLLIKFITNTETEKELCVWICVVSMTCWPWLPPGASHALLTKWEEMRNPDGRGVLTLKTHTHTQTHTAPGSEVIWGQEVL